MERNPDIKHQQYRDRMVSCPFVLKNALIERLLLVFQSVFRRGLAGIGMICVPNTDLESNSFNMNACSRRLSLLILISFLSGPFVSVEAGVVDTIVKSVAKRASTVKKGADAARKIKPTKKAAQLSKAKKSKRAEQANDLADVLGSGNDRADCDQGKGGKRAGNGQC